MPEQFALIVSTGRTATQALAHYLDSCYPQICALHEPKPSRFLRLVSNRFLSGNISKERALEIFLRKRTKLFRSLQQPLYIESSNFLHGFAAILNSIFPSYKVIHVVRDPRTYVPSILNHGTLRGLKGLAARYCPYWYMKPELLEKSPEKRWDEMQDYEKLIWNWRFINSVLNECESVLGANYLRLRFEDMFKAENPSILTLVEWLGLEKRNDLLQRAKNKLNKSRLAVCPKWEEWPSEWKELLLSHCGDLMRMYGYE